MNIRQNKYFKKGILALVVLILIYLMLHACSKKEQLSIPLPKVLVQQPITKSMIEYVTQTGTLVAYNSVDLVARVEGYLQAIEFVDGSVVKKNKELFVIEPLPYLERLKAEQASVEIAKAELAYAKSEYARQQKMYQQNATSLNSVESWFAKSQQAQGELDKAIANEKQAEITYSYTHVLAPFDGMIGRHQVSVGNLVGNGTATNLATIQQIDPLYVYFNLNELDLIRLREAAKAAGITRNNLNQIPIDVALQTEDEYTHKAMLDFVNTGLNASTGTMELRAVLENHDEFFVPGLFVRVRVAITPPTPYLTVPDSAVLYDQIGPYVLLVNNENKVKLQRVVLGPKNNGLRGIVKGIQKNDRVIVDGIQNASPGRQVDPQTKEQFQQ